MAIGRHGLRVQSLFEIENLRPVCRLEAERMADMGKAEMAREYPPVGLAEAVGKGVFVQTWTFMPAIRAPDPAIRSFGSVNGSSPIHRHDPRAKVSATTMR